MFEQLGKIVARHWLLVIVAWVSLALVLHGVPAWGWRGLAPVWDDVTLDGDFAYLPSNRPSIVGQRLMVEAFPDSRSESQIVLVIRRTAGISTKFDRFVAYDVARRFHNIHGAASIARARRLADRARVLATEGRVDESAATQAKSIEALAAAEASLDEAIELDEDIAAYCRDRSAGGTEKGETNEVSSNTLRQGCPPRLAAAYFNRALVHDLRGEGDAAKEERRIAQSLDPAAADWGDQPVPALAIDFPVLDIWTWRTEIFGEKLLSQERMREQVPLDDGTLIYRERLQIHARLVILHLSNEFMSTENVFLLQQCQNELEQVRRWIDDEDIAGLELGVSGSAAVGGDLLLASKESIDDTELYAIILVTLILALVYRSPLLVAVPLVTIVVSLLIATSSVALLTQLNHVPGFSWWEFKVFKTTKIFIVVILYGAGTDFCLFLISRYREELAAGLSRTDAVVKSLGGVGDALAASALTTILGLAMMFFAEFGKFRYSGPAIGLCLFIALLACLTLAPALLQALGRVVFWPWGVPTGSAAGTVSTTDRRSEPLGGDVPGRLVGVWRWVARWIVAYPGRILVCSLLLLAAPAGFGWMRADQVTYDMLASLDPQRPSRQGSELLRGAFDIGESGPISVLAKKDGAAFLDAEGDVAYDARDAIWNLAIILSDMPGVKSVRSFSTPIGRPPGKSPYSATRTIQQRSHITKALYVTQVPRLKHSVTRLEIVLDVDPFSIEATQTLSRIDNRLREESEQSGSFWSRTEFAYTGTTAAIRDLRDVTTSDNRRIQILVVVAVFLVLLVILKRPLVCLYMIASVLLSYYVTIGISVLVFQWSYGDTFQGLDWKVPLFLFVILVAIGQDYNIYLATRVFEEQRQHGQFDGLRRAIVRTGGIITSCGVIMAGTFISMTSGTWGYFVPGWFPLPAGWLSTDGGTLRGIVELGFALALGVLLDTFVVRPILVPAFLALLCRWRAALRLGEHSGNPPGPA